ncbi:MAG: PEP-CTERM sorting domain-containing protein [Desulfobacteraceae bacterium]|jgi:hypothetical protein|nr:MAG: PEP-CTERM sorting domain-containing protein [Desulfobacteraceae bacterium]
MKKNLMFAAMLLAVVALMATSSYALPLAVGNSVKFEYVNPHAVGGGPFNVFVNGSSEASFKTFCVEETEYITIDATYFVDSIQDTAKLTGWVLNDQVAWLYTQYYTGAEGDGAGIQEAIWWFTPGARGINNSLVASANAAVAGGWKNNGRVQIFNPVEVVASQEAIIHKQSMLVYVPEPSTMLLMGLGMLGLGLLSRKRRAR